MVTTSQVDTVISVDPADGDVPLVWNITGDAVVDEGGFANYTVSYTGDRLNEGETATIVVSTGPGFTGTLTDATANIDYGSLTTTLTFTAGGKNAQTLSVSTVADTLAEGDEDYTVRITSPSVGQSNQSQVNTVIDDQVVGPDIDWHITGDPIAGEMNGIARYTVGYTGDPLAPGQTATVTVGTGSGGWTSTLPDAIAGGDYTGLNTVLTFTGGGVTQRTVGVSIIFDTLNEGQEDYTVTIGGASAGTVVTSQANTVIDQVNNATTVDEDQGPAVYTIWYTGAAIAPGVTATIAVATGGGFTGTLNDAGGGVDYTSVMTTLTFTGGGPTFQTIAVSLIDDTLLEGDEDYSVTIGNQSDGSVGTSQSNTVIVDDEASSLVWNIVGASQVSEGDNGVYTVSYTGAAIAPGQTALVTVQTGVADGDPNDATPNVDYTSLSTILTFTGGGVTSRTVAVSTVEDTLAEATEDYQVEISTNAGTIGNGEQHTNIVDDDGTSLVWSIGPSAISVDEAEHQVATVSYTGAPIAPGFTALVTVSTGGGWGTFPDATSDVDFTSFTTTLTFTSGTGTTQTLGLSTIGDTIVEGTEDYTITIGGVSHGSVGASQSNVSIIDDDGTSLVWNVTGNTSVAEGGSTTYTVSYTGATLAPGASATVVVASANSAATFPNATAGADYTALTATTLTFTGGGVTQRTVAVSTIQDTVFEATEDYAVVLGNQSVGNLGSSQANTVIVDNDGTSLVWRIDGAPTTVNEGSASLYTVSYTGATIGAGQTATITVSTADLAGGSPNATSNTDYTALNTVLTFTSGSATSRTVAVTTVQDTIIEGTEDFRVTIAGQSAGSINAGASQVNAAIVDNDATSISWQVTGETAVGEGGNATYSVSYTGVTIGAGQTATITVATAPTGFTGTLPDATSGTDYTALNTVLTFTAGTGTVRTVAVSAIVDTALEGTEDFRVTLAGQSSGTISTSQANTVIVDVSGDFRINEVSVNATVSAPGGVATNHWIELRNTGGTAQLTTAISVEILGATGAVKTVVLPGLSVPAGGFIVLYEQGADARYGVYNSAGVLQSSGAIAGGGSWNFGGDTTQRIGVNIVASGASTDIFVANGAATGSFTGAPTWTSPGLAGSGYAAAAGLFSGSADLITEQASYNGLVDNQLATLQRLGLQPGTAQNSQNGVYVRVDTADNSNGTDWVTATNQGDTAGALNNGSNTNPNDPAETLSPDQSTAVAGEGQDILQRPDGSAGSLDGLLGNDYLYGGTNIDTLIGGGGDDFLYGHSGNDRLFGGPGGDLMVDVSGTLGANLGEYMEGGSGHDILLGTYGASANTAFMLLVGDVSLATGANNGNDWIAGGNNADVIIGDGINFAAFSQATFLANPFAAGQPIVAYGNRIGTGNDTLLGFGGNDRIGGAGGIDSILGGTGEDTIEGDTESDHLEGESGSDSIIGGAGSDQIWGDEQDGGGTGDDTLFGDAGADALIGGAGFDLVHGNTGNDYLEGNFGNDTLHGGINDDTLVGGPGIDLYGLEESGGVLFDFGNAAPAPGGWQIMNLTAYGLGIDWFREMEGVAGSGGSDTIIDGIGGGQYYQGNGGNDSYTDGEGQDTYDMGGGPGDHDTLSFGSITLTAIPNTVIGFGTSFDATPPDSGDQDYIDIDAIFDAFGVSDANRTNPAFVRVFDPGPGPAPVELQIDVDGPGIGTFVTLVVFEGHTSSGGFSIGNSASDDIQIGSL